MEDTVNIRYVVEFENAQNIFCSRSFPTREAAEEYAREHLQSQTENLGFRESLQERNGYYPRTCQGD